MNAYSKPTQCAGCPLAKRGTGFVPGSLGQAPLWVWEGGAVKPNLAPRLSEVKLVGVGEAVAFQELVEGRPFVGPAGNVLRRWVAENAGVDLDEAVLDNPIRCVQPGNQLPEVKVLRQAWAHCRQYDRYEEITLDLDLMTLHPASLLRDPVPLPLVIADFGKAREFVEGGKRVRVLMGAAACQRFHPYAANPTRWRGHFTEASSNGLET